MQGSRGHQKILHQLVQEQHIRHAARHVQLPAHLGVRKTFKCCACPHQVICEATELRSSVVVVSSICRTAGQQGSVAHCLLTPAIAPLSDHFLQAHVDTGENDELQAALYQVQSSKLGIRLARHDPPCLHDRTLNAQMSAAEAGMVISQSDFPTFDLCCIARHVHAICCSTNFSGSMRALGHATSSD